MQLPGQGGRKPAIVGQGNGGSRGVWRREALSRLEGGVVGSPSSPCFDYFLRRVDDANDGHFGHFGPRNPTIDTMKPVELDPV